VPTITAPIATPVPTLAPTQSSVVNIAKGKPASESSIKSGAAASRAVDGNTDGVFANNSVSMTNQDMQSWWQVDLGASHAIKTINLFNRTDCCSVRLGNYYVFVSDSPFTSTDLTKTINQAGVTKFFFLAQAGKPTTINVNHSGRYVRVQLALGDNLQLAEVQVMALH
jgi:hypothetical protein